MQKSTVPGRDPKIFLAVPLGKNSQIHVETAVFCSKMNHMQNVSWAVINTMSAELSRNSLLEHHLRNDSEWTHVLFLDSDVVPPDDSLQRLLSLGVPAACGLYPLFMKGNYYWDITKGMDDIWWPMEEDLPNEPFPILKTGGGMLLVERPVIVEMGYPWFEMKYQEVLKNNGKGIKCGEDVFFCNRLKELGYELIADPSVRCKHYNQVDLMASFYANSREVKPCPKLI